MSTSRSDPLNEDDVALAFAHDINPILIEAFLEEAPQQAARFSDSVMRLSAGGGIGDVVQAQRIAHSLKGSANLTGVRGIASLTHHVEDILDHLAGAEALPTRALTGLLSETADCVAGMVDALAEGREPPANALDVLARLLEWRTLGAGVEEGAAGAGVAGNAPGPPPSEPRPAIEPPPSEPPPAIESWPAIEPPPSEPPPAIESRPAIEPPPSVPSQATESPPPSVPPLSPPSAGLGAPESPASVAPAATVEAPPQSLRVPTRLVDGLLKLAGELAISNVQAQGSHQRMMAQATTLREQYHLVQQRLLDMQDVVEIRGVPSGRRGHRAQATPRPSNRMTEPGTPSEGFDPLELDEYDELHSKSQALTEAVTDFCEIALGLREELLRLDDTIVDQQRISKDLSDSVLSARMVAVGVIEQRLQRGVRETCRMTGKQAKLTLSGTELLVDGDVLNALVDPLLHLLRNAIDHGIEHPEQRIQLGKLPEGQLRLLFGREGDNVVVQCCDDGRGFDVGAIREVAEHRGLMSGSDNRTDREIYQLTMLPGFSTRRGATQVSGRGIGMDVVNKAVIDLKGGMDIMSQAGRGATVMLRVPLTLISMHVLLVRVGQRIYGVPSSSLMQVLFSDAGALQQIGSEFIFTFEDSEYTVRFLSELVGEAASARSEILSTVMPLLLLEADSGATAVFVDAAVDGRYLVVKTLGELCPKPQGVIGASILGDASVAPVLDLRALLRNPVAVLPEDLHSTTTEPVLVETPPPEVLIVDDSLTARRMLSITIGDGGFRVRTAIDGLDAIEAIEDQKPDLLVTDLEMPRMNGLELAAHLRAEPETRDLPILMVTSRSTQKHRAQAGASGINDFITKPYSNEELLDVIERLLETVDA